MLVLVAVAGCGGASPGTLAPEVMPALATLARPASLPQPFDERSMHAVVATLPIGARELAFMPHINPATHAVTSAGRSLQNTADNDGGGQAGYIINPGTSAGDGSIYAAMTAYDDAWVTTPTNGYYNTVNAPTTHGPNGNCIEVVTNYYNGFGTPGTTVDQVQFYDFCANNGQGGFVGALPMDAAFVRDYVRLYSDLTHPMPRYISAVIHSAIDNRWHAYLYNASIMQYVDYYDAPVGASTSVLGSEGWTIFETHYNGGDCTTLPDASVTGLQVRSSSGWQPLNANAVYSYVLGTCFSGPLVAPYYLPTFTTSPSVAWTVTSPVAPPLSEYARAIRKDAPAAFYRFGDTTSRAIDSSGAGLSGAYGANVVRDATSLLTVESANGAAQFPGGTTSAASVISVPASPLLAPRHSVSLEAWVQESRVNPGTTNDLVAYGSRLTGLSYTLQILPNNTAAAFVTTSTGYGLVTSSTVLSAHRTYLIDATYDGSKLSLYLDGRLDASAPATGDLRYVAAAGPSGLSIGSAFDSTRPVFAGTLDDVAIFPSALAPAQIAAHWTSGSGVAVAPGLSQYAAMVDADAPLAFYRLSDFGRTAHDSGPNHIDAAYGAAVTADVAGLLSTDAAGNAAQFPGGTSSAIAAVTTARNGKLEPRQTLSLETWIEVTQDSPGTIDLVSYGPEKLGIPYTLQLLANRTAALYISTVGGYGMVIGASTLSLNTPHLIDATYDGSTARIYVDGVLDASHAATGALSYASETAAYGLSIGTAYDTYRSAFGGILDDVAIYGTVLSPQRVAAHWIAGSGRPFAPAAR